MSDEVGLEKSPVVDLHICIEIAIEQCGFLFARMNNFKSNVSNHSLGRCQIQKNNFISFKNAGVAPKK